MFQINGNLDISDTGLLTIECRQIAGQNWTQAAPRWRVTITDWDCEGDSTTPQTNSDFILNQGSPMFA